MHKLRMWISDESPGGTMVFRGIHDKNWYLHPKECILYREVRQRDQQFSVMFSSGVMDKLGYEIYQSDILMLKKYKTPYVVSDLLHFGWRFHEFVCDENLIEIIGNIHEHPQRICTHSDRTLLMSYPAKILCNQCGWITIEE